jgi:hypothetical protein
VLTIVQEKEQALSTEKGTSADIPAKESITTNAEATTNKSEEK